MQRFDIWNMRQGFTTGSCAAAASRAATQTLLTGKNINTVTIRTPKGVDFTAEIVDLELGSDYCRCAVVKDGGDDPDITTGAHIVATVRRCNQGIIIKGGDGVGRVTMPGLDQPVGEAAINHVPREMIKEAVLQVANICDYEGGFEITISVPEGDKIAEKTFNPKLGIKGGISIIGTSGVVEPMSMQAIKDTIRVELRQKRAMGYDSVIVSPGNYGVDFMKNTYDYELGRSVKCSNFVGDTIDMAKELGFKKVLFAGHIGKLIKVSGGIMNTHSKEADCRMELLLSALIRAIINENDMAKVLDENKKIKLFEGILQSATTDYACGLLKNEGLLDATMREVLKSCLIHMRKRGRDMDIECIIFSSDLGLLCESNGARDIIEELRG